MTVIDVIVDVLGWRARNKVAFGVGAILVMALGALLWLGWNSGTIKL